MTQHDLSADLDARRRASALEGAHHALASAMTAMAAAAAGEPDHDRVQRLARAHASAADIERELRRISDVR